MRILSVVGARPQFVKLAPIASAISQTTHDHVIVHTGQHYDPGMSDAFFADLAIPDPDVHLGVGSGSHGKQTGAMLAALDDVMAELSPDWVLVYGDTNSTLAAALSAVKLHFPLAHLEAGLRSFNRRMAEEHNRVLTDHCADLLLAPTALAAENLCHEGLSARTVVVGDVMTDILFRTRDAVANDPLTLPAGIDTETPYLVATIHRADNTDDPERLAALVEALAAAPIAVALLVHPRLKARADSFGIPLERGAIVTSEPLGYPQMVRAVLGSVGVVTDSGGLQKEAYLLGRTCTTLRTETEWNETLVDGWNVLAPDVAGMVSTALRPIPTGAQQMPYGDGRAAVAVVAALTEHGPQRPPAVDAVSLPGSSVRAE